MSTFDEEVNINNGNFPHPDGLLTYFFVRIHFLLALVGYISFLASLYPRDKQKVYSLARWAYHLFTRQFMW